MTPEEQAEQMGWLIAVRHLVRYIRDTARAAPRERIERAMAESLQMAPQIAPAVAIGLTAHLVAEPLLHRLAGHEVEMRLRTTDRRTGARIDRPDAGAVGADLCNLAIARMMTAVGNGDTSAAYDVYFAFTRSHPDRVPCLLADLAQASAQPGRNYTHA